MTLTHKHHIIPRHAGGTDDPSNLVELTVEEHAEAHRKLWEEFGRQEDYLAWQGLSGRIGKEEIIRQRNSIGGKTTFKRHGSLICKAREKATPEQVFEWHSNAGKHSTNKGSRWWSNGTDYKFVANQPEGYLPSGAPNNPGSITKGSVWWNNGSIHKRSSTCPGDGWEQGRINKGNLGGSRIHGNI